MQAIFVSDMNKGDTTDKRQRKTGSVLEWTLTTIIYLLDVSAI